MRVAFFGTSAFAVPILAALRGAHDVVAVVTQPDRPAGRGHRLTPTPVKTAALAHGVRVLTPERLRPFVDEARTLGADVFAVASYGKIVPQVLLDVVPVAFNVHPSLLPLYRGATPLQSALRDGRTETGVTIIAMDAGMDTGPVLVREATPLGADEIYGALHDRLAQRGAMLLLDAMRAYADGTQTPRPQADVAAADGLDDAQVAATVTRPWTKADYVVADDGPPQRRWDHVRACLPAPGARCTVAGEPLKVTRARRAAADEANGTVTADGGAVWNGVVLLEVTPPNRGTMPGAAWQRAGTVRA